MKTRKTLLRSLAGILSALMILSPIAAYASASAPADEESYVSYGASGADAEDFSSYAWVTPITSEVKPNVGGANEISFDLPKYVHDPLERYSATASQPVYYAPG